MYNDNLKEGLRQLPVSLGMLALHDFVLGVTLSLFC